MFAYSNDGSMRSIDPGMEQPGEVLFAEIPTDDQLESAFPGYKAAKGVRDNNSAILAQIQTLEAAQTMRRMREAIAGTDGGWLSNLESQIAALRAQLLP